MTTAAADGTFGLSLRDCSALFAAVVVAAVAVIGPVAGEDAVRPPVAAGARTLPSEDVNVALRQAATQLTALRGADVDAQQRALSAVAKESEVALRLSRQAGTACVEATHPVAPGQVWSYDAATGAIANEPC